MQRLSSAEALSLFRHAPLNELVETAQAVRRNNDSSRRVTYILDANPNYTNICTTQCSFCSFCRHEGQEGAYHKTIDEILVDIAKAASAGATSILLQGGLNPRTTLPYLIEITRAVGTNFPKLHRHFFSIPEIAHAATVSGVSLDRALSTLYQEGLRTIPGAGAEILSDEVHQMICPRKISPQAWLDGHLLAHRIGFLSTATMMFGHVEADHHIVEHLIRLRDLQDQTKGFLSFIPWSFKPEHNALGTRLYSNKLNDPDTIRTKASATTYYRILALSRMVLDNFPHITASWFGEGKNVGAIALSCGADDFGGTIFMESVHRAAGHALSSSEAEIRTIIEQAGYQPVRRDAFFFCEMPPGQI